MTQSSQVQQTSIDWFLREIGKYMDTSSIHDVVIEKAKEMEKQQIKDSYKFGVSDEYVIGAEQYYDNTYKK